MKKQYTKKQIQEAITFWEKQLNMMCESSEEDLAWDQICEILQEEHNFSESTASVITNFLIDGYKNAKIDSPQLITSFNDKKLKDAIEYYVAKQNNMNESTASRKFHQLKSYADLENKETADCALMQKLVNHDFIYRWVPFDEIYDMHFKNGWDIKIDLSEYDNPDELREKVKKYIDDLYGV